MERRVVWIGAAPAEDEVAQVLYEALVTRGLSGEEEVAAYLADTLFRRDFDRGGWIVDIGFFWSLYLADAHRTMDRLNGRLVRLC
jgi:hypothetical protein